LISRPVKAIDAPASAATAAKRIRAQVLTALRLPFLAMRVLVTGGAGFIGSHFAKRLAAAGDEVAVLDKLTYSGNRANLHGTDVEFFEGDICDPEAIAEAVAGAEAIVNFAAETHVDRSILGAAEFIETDVLGTYVLLRFARDAGIRLVQVSTDEVYGDVPEGRSSKEDDPLRPSSPYSASKAGGDLQVLAAVRTFGIDACVTRGANTYGPSQYPEKLIPLFVTNALDGEPLPVYGDGRQQREWLHVRDHCTAVELVLREGRPGETYNIGGDQHENLELTTRILELTGADPRLVRHVDDRPGHDRRYALDDAKLRAAGWVPEVSLGAGLAETVAWYREHRAWWEPIKSGEYREYYRQQYAERLR
jgi:dTDP-glucose 4,6-dehydratase